MCSLALHEHTADCFDESGAPVCGDSDFVVHTHDTVCYDASGALWCSLPEIVPHAHEERCYGESGTLVCEQAELLLHTHTATCYTEENRLVCSQAQVLEHIHTQDCLAEAANSEPLTCTVPAGEGGHAHIETCYNESGTLICALAESEGHQHGTRCYGTWELNCGLEEHTHSLACYADPTADLETAEDWEQSLAGVTLNGVWAEDVLRIAQSQLGYTESTANYTVAEDGVTKNGYTRYGAWYGNPYDGWCAAFLSFCLHYAKVPVEEFPRAADCSQWLAALQKAELFASADSSYHPSAADLVFFDRDLDGQADHMGLVQALAYNKEAVPSSFTTIEGDREGAVTQGSYLVDDGTILGYGTLSQVGGAETLAGGDTWGYNADGSIWWTDPRMVNTTAIQADTPYAILGNQGVKFLACEEQVEAANGKTYRYIKAVRKETLPDFAAQKAYQAWCFQDAGNGKYHLYFQDSDGGRQYLCFSTESDHKYASRGGKQIYLTNSMAEATAFTVAPCTNPQYADHMTIGAELDGKMYYLNTCGGDSDTRYTWWFAFPNYEAGCFLQIGSMDEVHTAHPMNTITSPNTVINLFDYWTNPEGRYASDVNKNYDGGINAGHSFKFSWSDPASTGMNRGTHNSSTVSGIVQNKLVDGYPVLSGTAVTYNSSESLAYLFNPTLEAEGKASYHNVSGLLRTNEKGYYYFNSHETMAEFDEDTNHFTVYDKPGVHPNSAENQSGEFFPFNKAPEVAASSANDAIINHYIGMTITTRFIQQHGGHADAAQKTPTTFYFSGDDDVWIFIDGVLVGDLGGKHTEVKVNIDFATGQVVVSNLQGKALSTTTLLEAFRAAGAEDTTLWNGNTFQDNSTHTLKFFYLERGNHDSNLTLQYNLTEIPKTAIYKVDQYGDTVPGATFAVYAADGSYQMLSNKGGAPVGPVEDPQYDAEGNLISDGKVLAHALYTGTTNEKGEMIFVDPDGMPYSLPELEGLFGSHFILREIKVPEGYRVVSKDVHLQIWHGTSQTILKCDNTIESGSRAAATLQVVATDILYLSRPYNGQSSVQYCDENGKTFGTLFAVVFKYTGAIDKDGNATQTGLDSAWTPLYGSDQDGYTLVPLEAQAQGGPAPSLVAALKAAAEAQARYGRESLVFTLSSNSTMQLTMENLPGHITTYYRMLGSDHKSQARYTVAYYWTDQSSLEQAKPENTFRVYTVAEGTPDGSNYSSFERVFGANIQVPNLINKLLVQKVDESENLVNGATFAIYPVRQDKATNEIQYLAADGGYLSLPADAVVAGNGVITAAGRTIQPLDIGVTQNLGDGIHTGTAVFSNLPDGQYIVKEVKAPAGYQLNTTDVMVLVTEDTIYANAGVDGDGVVVGRGPGYVVTPLNQFASEGQIDNTLSWIYAQMQISSPSTSFADVGDLNKIAGYLTENKSGKTSKAEADAVRTYLQYAADHADAAFNYIPNPNRTAETGAQHPTGTRRLFTTSGWPYYEIRQDYAYGQTAKSETANYEDWSAHDLTNLFSRSTYIRVMDFQETDLAVKKVSEANPNITLAGAQFRLYRQNAAGEKEYYYRDAADTVHWETAEKALVITTGADGLSTDRFTKLSDGIYYLEEIKAPAGYRLPSKPVGLELRFAVMQLLSSDPAQNHLLEQTQKEDNSYLYTITLPNSSGHELPDTGGSGTFVFYSLGASLLLTASALLFLKKRRTA